MPQPLARLILLLGGVILFSSLLGGATYFQAAKHDLIEHHADDLEATLAEVATNIGEPVADMRRDTLLLASLRATATLAAGRCISEEQSEIVTPSCLALENLAQSFKALLQINPAYAQVRLIGAADEGRELLRFDQREGQITRTPETGLQRKGHRPYMSKALRLKPGEVYLSEVDLNWEHGQIEQPLNPVIRAATPIMHPDGTPFGIVIINLRFGPLLEQAVRMAPERGTLYITNQAGDLLQGPNPEKHFGFELGTRHLIQDEYPVLAPWLGKAPPRFMHIDDRLIGAVRIPINPAHSEGNLVAVCVQPTDTLLTPLRQTLWGSATITLLLLFTGLGLAVLLADRFNRSFRLLTEAARRFAEGDISAPLPREGNREITLLSESFDSMRQAVMEQAATLREQEEYLRTLIDTATEGILTTDVRGVILSVNPVAARMFGYSADEMLGQNVTMLMPSTYAEHHHRFMTAHAGQSDNKPLIGRTVMGRRKNGDSFPITIGLATFEAKGERQFAAFIQDVSELQAAEDAIRQAREIESLAYYDPLTGLPNRRLLRERFGQQLNLMSAAGKQLAVALIDLDGFKDVNDRLGHEAGDRLLKQIARRLQDSLRGGDIVSRLGGDEFALILPEIHGRADLDRPLRALLDAVAEPVDLGNESARVSASIGLSLFPQDGKNIDTLLRKADIAMYQAKAAGRNRHHFFDPSLEHTLLQRHDLRTRLEQALDRNELELYYQPQVNLVSGEVTGAEALIRWNDPEKGQRLPGEFIPVAEEGDLIVRFGRWVTCAALHQLEAWNSQGLRLELGINVAARQFLDPGFVDDLSTLLQRHHTVAPAQVTLEITETAAMEDFQRAREVILACQALGVGFSLDDFGTGFSSLTYLQQLPVQSLKIDRSFVRDILEDANDAAIAKGIIDMARLLNLPVVAEGVENVPLANRLLEFGCRLGQGYGIARPMPAKALPGWIADWRRPDAWNAHFEPAWDDRHFGLLFARQAHEHWLERLLDWVRTDHPQGEPIPTGVMMDSQLCAFGRWCNGPGHELYKDHGAFERLQATHHAVHEIANAMFDQMTAGNPAGARERIPELVARRDELLALLDAMRQQEG